VLLISPAGKVLANFNASSTATPVTAGQQPTFNGVWGQGVGQFSGQVSFYYGTTGSGATGVGGGEVWRLTPHPTATTKNGQPVNATYVELATGLGDNATVGGKDLPVTAANAAGPQGFAFDAATDVLYVSDDADNTIYAIPNAAAATGPQTPQVVLRGGPLNTPENIALDPTTGQLLVANAGNNTILALNPQTGAVMGSEVVDPGAAGALFGLAAQPNGMQPSTFYFVNDNTNTLNALIPPAPPTASTGNASHVTATGATLNGVIHANGTPTYWQFQYGTSTRYGRATPVVTIPGGQGDVTVSAHIAHLRPGTVIHFRLVAIPQVSGEGMADGADATFRTATAGFLRLGTGELHVFRGHVRVPLICASPLDCRGEVHDHDSGAPPSHASPRDAGVRHDTVVLLHPRARAAHDHRPRPDRLSAAAQPPSAARDHGQADLEPAHGSARPDSRPADAPGLGAWVGNPAGLSAGFKTIHG
jgi:DNA-binding beta-propeller fold protein YncE